MSITLRFWGTRGSVPAPGAHTVRYGGNTPCLEARTGSGALLIFDAGTGIRALGRTLVAKADGSPIRGEIFLSHAHWDHIQGLPFFQPIFGSGNRFTIWSMAALAPSVDRVVREQMSPTVFPVSFDALDACVDFRAMDATHEGAGYTMRALPVRHPGGALAYRLSERNNARALVYISDNELGAASHYDSAPDWRDALVEFTRGAAVLVHDAMYTTAEYAGHHGWGHSTDRDALELALEAGVERLVLYHHSPERTDDEIDARVEECRSLALARGAGLDIVAAAEGLELSV
jgi:phosphoribosyl 1,2-cyclic phosphodiesterase